MNLVSSVSSFYIRTKFTLKIRVTTVHLLQCKTNFSFIYAFEGEICGKLKSTHLDLFTLDYICLGSFSGSSTHMYIRLDSSSDLSALLYVRLDSSSDSSTLFYICLHSSTLVYTCLVTCLCF